MTFRVTRLQAYSRERFWPVVAKLETGKDEVVLRVADDGIGIPAGSEEQLFEPFVKLDRVFLRKFHPTGW